MKNYKKQTLSVFLGLTFALVLVLASACSKKGGSGNGCPTGMSLQNGFCQYDSGVNPGTNPGGSSSMYYPAAPNGSISNESKFRDFHQLLSNVRYYCLGSGNIYGIYFRCTDIGIKVQKISDTNYYVSMTTPSLQSSFALFNATRFNYGNGNSYVLNIYRSNPVVQIVAELEITPVNEQYSQYQLFYRTNSTSYEIARGTLTNGIDNF